MHRHDDTVPSYKYIKHVEYMLWAFCVHNPTTQRHCHLMGTYILYIKNIKALNYFIFNRGYL